MNGCPKVQCTHPLCKCVTDENTPLAPAEQQGTTTPRTDAAIAGVDFFITDSDQRAYSATDYECLRDEMKKLERELSLSREDCERLREALRAADAARDAHQAAQVALSKAAKQYEEKFLALEREHADLRAEAERLREEVNLLRDIYAEHRSVATLAATRKEEGNG